MTCTIIEYFMSTTCAHASEILKGDDQYESFMGVQVSWNNSTDLGWHAAVVCVKHVCLLRLYSSQQREEREEEEEKKHLIHSEGLASSTKKRRKPQAVASSLNGHTPSSLEASNQR